jgi:hypothetical protein
MILLYVQRDHAGNIARKKTARKKTTRKKIANKKITTKKPNNGGNSQ